MSVMGISENDQYNVMCIVAGILHMGNITFREQNNYAAISDDECKYTFDDVDSTGAILEYGYAEHVCH